MYCVLDSKNSPLKADTVGNDDSPHKSDTSHISFSKSIISKKNTEVDHVQEVSLVKTKSNFSKHKEEGHRHVGSINNNETGAEIGDYGQFSLAFEGSTQNRKFSLKQTDKELINSPERINQSLDDDQDQKQLFSDENEESERISQNMEIDKNYHTSKHTSSGRKITEQRNIIDENADNFTSGKQGRGDDGAAPRIEFTDYNGVSKGSIYEINQLKKYMDQNLKEHMGIIQQVSKESKEYNLILHSELEGFVKNKKKEFYQKFVEIKHIKEEQDTIKISFIEMNNTLKQICIVLSCLVEGVALLSHVLKNKSKSSIYHSAVDVNSSHNDSLMINKSFLPASQNRNHSRMKGIDDKIVKASRNISKELFQGPNMSTYLAQSRLSTQTKSGSKSNSRIMNRLKTPDIMLQGQSYDNKSVIEELGIQSVFFY